MHASGLEVADIFHQAGAAYRQQHADSLSRGQRCVMSAIERCRTYLKSEQEELTREQIKMMAGLMKDIGNG